jgi:hypothetical protein
MLIVAMSITTLHNIPVCSTANSLVVDIMDERRQAPCWRQLQSTRSSTVFLPRDNSMSHLLFETVSASTKSFQLVLRTGGHVLIRLVKFYSI